jgi:hypothetical protein
LKIKYSYKNFWWFTILFYIMYFIYIFNVKLKHVKTSVIKYPIKCLAINVATLLLEEWEDDSHTPKMGTWESAGTPKILKFDFRGQNTLHWGVLYIIGKLSKCTCRKWACMSHLDICSTNYDKKKRHFKLDSIQIQLKILNFNSNCMQCHSIFSF